MNRALLQLIAALALLSSGAYIWLHTLRWWRLDSDSILLLGNFALLYYLGIPWRRTAHASSPRPIPKILFPAILLYGIGIVSGLSWPMALGWTLAFYCFLRSSFEPQENVRITRLLPFALFGFPWISLDGQTLGWYFRISGAQANEWIFALLGLDVTREGANMVVNGVVIRVTEECAGLNALQAMMVAGGFLAFHFFHQTKLYWPAWGSLLIVVWLSNTLRIFLLGVTGLTFGVDFAMGPFHDWGGLVALTIAFVLAGSSFHIASSLVNERPPQHR